MQRTEEYHLSHTSYGPKSLKYLKHIRRALFITFTRFEDIAPAGLCVLRSGKQTVQHEDKALKPIFFFFSCVVTFLWTCPPPLPRFPACLRHSGDPLKKTLSSLSLTSSEPLTDEPSPAPRSPDGWRGGLWLSLQPRGARIGWIKRRMDQKAHGSGWNCKT